MAQPGGSPSCPSKSGQHLDANRAKKEETDTVVAAFDPRAVLDVIDGARSDLTLRAGDAVFRQGDAADSVFYVKSGRVQLTVVSD